MAELRELYQELILEHSKNPRNFRVLPDATASVEGFMCGVSDRCAAFGSAAGLWRLLL